jgi:hypothetical protein
MQVVAKFSAASKLSRLDAAVFAFRSSRTAPNYIVNLVTLVWMYLQFCCSTSSLVQTLQLDVVGYARISPVIS